MRQSIRPRMGLMFFRADIRPGFEGHISTILETEQIIENTVGRCTIDDIRLFQEDCCLCE